MKETEKPKYNLETIKSAFKAFNMTEKLDLFSYARPV